MNQIRNMLTIIATSILLLAVAFILGRCSNTQSTSTVTIRDTVTHTDTVSKPTPYAVIIPKVEWKHDTIKGDSTTIYIDSNSCIQIATDYYTKKTFQRTLVNDSILWFTLTDTCFKNELLASKYEYSINRPQTIIQEKKRMFVAGVQTDFNGVNIQAGLFLKNWMITGGYDLVQNRKVVSIYRTF